jgi:hypothetical protein
MEWRIYYSDGSTFDSNQGNPFDAPTEFFICAVGYDEKGHRYIMHGWNYYRWDKETCQWWGMDNQGLKTRLRHNGEIYAYKEGYTITKAQFNAIMERAHKDPDFPQR